MTTGIRDQLRAYCAYLDEVEGVGVPHEGSLTVVEMMTDESPDVGRREDRRSRAPWLIGLAAAIVAAVVAAVVVLDSGDGVQVDGDVAGEVDETIDAPHRVEQWFDALVSGDVDAVAAGLSPEIDDNSRATLLAQAETAATTGTTLYDPSGCETSATSPSMSEVTCTFLIVDPVFEALGLDEGSWLFFVDDTGILPGSHFGADASEANAAYSDYLQLFRADDFARACDPTAPALLGYASNSGLALGPECFALMSQTADEVVAWIDDGRPQP